MNWAYGITSCLSRTTDGTLERTLASLRGAGFVLPTVWIDGCTVLPLAGVDIQFTLRYPAVGCWGNWWLGLQDLWIRNPKAEMFAMFQDDILICRNAMKYLDRLLGDLPPLDRYFNLYTAPSNQKMLDAAGNREPGFYVSNGLGKGALALVFPRDVMPVLLSHQFLVDKPRQSRHPTRRNDGAVTLALAQRGIVEHVHQPSLVQHVGENSTLVTDQINPDMLRAAPSFPGDTYNALDFLESSCKTLTHHQDVTDQLDSGQQ